MENIIKTVDVLVVRVYITDASGLSKEIPRYLKETIGVRGLSVFRAISGFGESGTHKASLMDLSMDLPLVIEFFDEKEKVQAALAHLNALVKPEHILFWEAKANG